MSPKVSLTLPTKHMLPWAHPSPKPEWHKNCFSRTANDCVQQTHEQRIISNNRPHFRALHAMWPYNYNNACICIALFAITCIKLSAWKLMSRISKFCLDEWHVIWDCYQGNKLTLHESWKLKKQLKTASSRSAYVTK